LILSTAGDTVAPGVRAEKAAVTRELTDESLDRGEQLDEEEAGEFVVSDEDDTDEPAALVTQVGATADPVKDYLRQIGRVPLLNAEQRWSWPSASRPACSPRRS
jgi:RNA polymerase primary sigma factor